MTAGAHLDPAARRASGQAGDMPPLVVTSGGRAEARVVIDLLIGDLRDADGSAVMVHAPPDNQANIPTKRYAQTPTR